MVQNYEEKIFLEPASDWEKVSMSFIGQHNSIDKHNHIEEVQDLMFANSKVWQVMTS